MSTRGQPRLQFCGVALLAWRSAGLAFRAQALMAVVVVIVELAKKQRGTSGNGLVPCPNCGRQISPLAESCPECGRPTGRR